MRWLLCGMFLIAFLAGVASAEEGFFPAPEFRSGHTMPDLVVSAPHSAAWTWIDSGVLLGALGVASWLVFKRRSRAGVFGLTVFALIYFGFFRKGCVCPIGAIQNVSQAAFGTGYALPVGVAIFFILPLLFTLFYGRVFCSSVCPLGAIQDVVLWKPVHVPSWLEHGLGLFAYIYLGLAVLFAAMGSDYIICRWDPFVGFFRLSGPAHMLVIGGVLLVLSMFVGRTYCRFICPYGVLLRLLSPFSRKRVTITPDECVDCRLCEVSCPFGAIRHPTPKEPARPGTGRRQLVMALAALPVLVGVFAWVGYGSSELLSRRDYHVQLAERLWQEEQGLVEGTTDASAGYRDGGEPLEKAYGNALAVQSRYAKGSAIFGVWMGLVVGLKLVALVVRRRRTGYTADPGGCVACARCYQSCPVELERKEQPEMVVA